MSDKAKRSVVRSGVPGVAVLGFVAAGVGFWQGQGQGRPATAQEAPSTQPVREALDGQTYARAGELRERLGVGDETLAAMALGRQEAEGVLEGVLAWTEANRPAWDARRQAVAAARRELAEAVRRVHAGQPAEGRGAGLRPCHYLHHAARTPGAESCCVAGHGFSRGKAIRTQNVARFNGLGPST